MLWQIIKPLLIFPKGLFGGLTGAVVMWIAVIVFFHWKITAQLRAQGVHGPIAVAGGWTELAHTPLVIVLLAVAFGLGFYLVIRH